MWAGSMTFPLRFFLAFAGLALLLVTGTIAYSAYLGQRLTTSVAACMEDGRRLFVLKESVAATPASSGSAAKEIQDDGATNWQLVHIPVLGWLRFPAGMSKEEMSAAIQRNFPTAQLSNAVFASGNRGGPNQSAISKTFSMTGTDGETYTLDAPAGSTKEQAAAIMQKSLGFTCDPDELTTISFRRDIKVLQAGPGQVLAAYRSKNAAPRPEVAYAMAVIVLGIGSVPALWYFLLRRLGEIANAVRRK